jgi:endo-1,4-beta-xylanase
MLRSIASLPVTYTSKFFSVLISFIIFGLLTACNPKDTLIAPMDATSTGARADVTSATNPPLDSNATLKSVARFPIGAAFNSNIITSNPKAYQLFAAQFNAKTVHAYLNTEQTQGKFNLKEVDYWVNFAQTNPTRLHGHCLLHNGSIPEWMLKFSGNTPAFEQAIKNHIQTIVGRYKGQIKSWDVVNELFEYNSANLRQTPFRLLYANDAAYLGFVKRCFEWAHAADPDALLFYNDFSLEAYPAKLQAVVNLVNDFKRSGTPIHGIGSQMHIDINTDEAGIKNSLRQLSSTGLQVHISELDIAVNPKNDQTITFSNQLLNVQGEKYKTVATLYKQNVPDAQKYGITLWDFSDGDSWLISVKKQLDEPTIFDKKLTKKAAFYGLLAGLK